MNKQIKTMSLMATLIFLVAAVPAVAENSAETNENMMGLQNMCSETAAAQADRKAHKSLYNRLGGYDKILSWTTEVVRLHHKNETIIPMLTNVDSKLLAKHVADFVASGTGGPQKYTGRSMPTSHAHLALTDADFLSAGGDIIAAAQNVGYGQNEIDEILCILLSLKDQVVFQ